MSGVATHFVDARLRSVVALMQAGRWGEARAALTELVAVEPRVAAARHLYGVVLERLGDLAGAERELRAGIAIDKRQAPFHADLGALMIALGRASEAERSLRAALALDRRQAKAAVALAELLRAQGRGAEALQTITPLAAGASPSEAVLAEYAEALKAVGREAEALAVYRRARDAFPHSRVAEHNVASALGGVGRHEEAEASARRALAQGLDAAETWLVLGRALQGQDRFDEAAAAFHAAIQRQPTYAEAHLASAQLVWMRSEDIALACATLDDALRGNPHATALRLVKSQLLESAGDGDGAYAALADAADAPEAAVMVRVAAARAALRIDPSRALVFAQAATAQAPEDEAARMALCEAHLALGQPEPAQVAAAGVLRRSPLNQHALAYQATAWRLLDDPRYCALYDYDAFVRPRRLEAPTGWSTLDAYLDELRAALARLHGLRTHPVGQSLRAGTQTSQNLRSAKDPAITAFFQAIDAPIRAHVAALGRGKDPLRARNLGGYALEGIWSVRLRPGRGRHVDHVHQKGWLSSACYIDLPPAIEEEGQQGWIKFGEPGTPTAPALGPEHFVKPELGLLVLFPSYIWHGTTPFGGDRPRLSVAFDLVPARG